MFNNWKKTLMAGVISLSLLGTGYVSHDLISSQNVSAEPAAKNAPRHLKKLSLPSLMKLSNVDTSG
ncbi:hypothetical protein Q5O89_00875 [Peribacillus frigoritolerans]|nr:hypothetical protein [Peribacillus frigoritolerans]